MDRAAQCRLPDHWHRGQRLPPTDPPKPTEELGRPSSYIYAEELSGRAIVAALRQRRAWVSMGARITFEARGEASPGEEPKVYGIGDDLGIRGGRIDLVAAVADSPLPGAARIVRNGTVLAEARLQDGAAALRVSEVLDPAAPAWYRLDVLDDAGLVLAITNPIFAGPRLEPERFRFGDFVAL